MKNQIIILATIIFTTIHPLFCMELAQQKGLNEELFDTIKSKEPYIIKEVQRLLDAGADPNARDENDIMKQNSTPLHYAARSGHEAACKLLLERRANIDARTDFKATPLMDAVAYPKILTLLLAHGAQVNALTKYNYHALFYAAATNADSCVLLLEHGANPTIQSLEDATPLMNAACWDDGSRNDMCTAIVTTQARINTTIRTALLCLNRLRNTGETEKFRISTGILYHEFKTLLLPHMGLYIPLIRLLNMRTTKRRRPYDQLKISCLDPDNIEAIYTQNAINKKTEPAAQAEQSWFSDCSIQ